MAPEALGTWVMAMAVAVPLVATDMALDMEAWVMATAIQFTMEDLDSPTSTEMFSFRNENLK